MGFIRREHEITLESPEGQTLARVTFPEVDDGTVDINHTFVDDSLRGQGIAGKLMEETVSLLKERNLKAVPSCSYAARWFEKHPEYEELLKKG